MATTQTGNWKLKLPEHNNWTDPLLLQHDLLVTRATLTRDHGGGGIHRIDIHVTVNDDPETVLCKIVNNANYSICVGLDRVFKRGDTLLFKNIWWGEGGPCAVTVEGCFKQFTPFDSPESTQLTLDSSDGGCPAVAEDSLVVEKKANCSRVLEQISRQSDISSEQMSSLETILTKQFTEIYTQNTELLKQINMVNLSQQQTVDRLEAKLGEMVEDKKALEEQLSFYRLKTKELEARNFHLDKKLTTLK